MSFKPCVIHVPTKALSEAVQRELKARRYSPFMPPIRPFEFLVVYAKGHFCEAANPSTEEASWPRFDAATQFGELLAYLHAPEEVEAPELTSDQRIGYLLDLLNTHSGLGSTIHESQMNRYFAMKVRELIEQERASQAARKEGK